MTEKNAGESRVFFRDVKPYYVPDSLEDLQGPIGGVIDLPHSVLWAPGSGRIDLNEQGGMELLYRAVLAEGLAEEQIAFLHRDNLVKVWHRLLIPSRVREMWESRFPELRQKNAA